MCGIIAPHCRRIQFLAAREAAGQKRDWQSNVKAGEKRPKRVILPGLLQQMFGDFWLLCRNHLFHLLAQEPIDSEQAKLLSSNQFC